MLIHNIFISLAFCFVLTQGVHEDVCLWEAFRANCSEDEVIVVGKAIYGQGSNSSRCANGTTNAGSCFLDVIEYFDLKCGGRQECYVGIPNKDLTELTGLFCKDQRKLYLAISYYCEYVYSAPGESCANKSLTVSTTVGYLSSIVAADTKKGSSMCPWKFRLNRDQSIRFSMLDFGLQQSNGASDHGDVCRYYATFELHNNPNEISRSVACGGDTRHKKIPIDVSTAREVDVSFTNLRSHGDDAIPFLIKYEVSHQPANDEIWIPELNNGSNDVTIASTNNSSFGQGIYTKWFLTGWPALIVLPVGIIVSVGVFCRIRKQRRQAEYASNSCTSEHHYSDVDVDQFTPETITDTIIVEDSGTTMDQLGSTAITPYSDLKRPLAVSVPVVYSDLQSDHHMVEDVQHSDTDDHDSTPVTVTPPYVNVIHQSIGLN